MKQREDGDATGPEATPMKLSFHGAWRQPVRDPRRQHPVDARHPGGLLFLGQSQGPPLLLQSDRARRGPVREPRDRW